jgi:catechol 2,3-dioxygenase-like lactoylglutathione lyase family enzyme
MIDHVILNVSDLTASRRFYIAALTPMGYEVIWDLPEWLGLGPSGTAEFWVADRKPTHTAVHVSFACDDVDTVAAFHEAGVGAGGLDNGAPGVREHYGPEYFCAFVLDPDGNNIEAVCRCG